MINNCPYCGNALEGWETFCNYCGQPIPKELQSQPQQPKKKTGLIIGIVAGLLGITLTTSCVLGILLWKNNTSTSESAVEPASSQETSSVVSTPPESAVVPAQTIPAITSSTVVQATASSYLKEPKSNLYHNASRVLDGKLDTAWVEGGYGNGIGETITLSLNGTHQMQGFTIYAGYHKSQELFYKNARPQQLQVTLSNGYTQVFPISDTFGPQTFTFGGVQQADYAQFKIVSVYPGTKYQDTVISELSLY